MRVQEYRAKRLLAAAGIPVPRGEIAETPEQARSAAERLGVPVVVKAQVLAGGRGRAGGVIPARSASEAQAAAARLLGKPLVTEQTGPRGYPVRLVLVEEALETERELYMGLTIDRARAAYTLLAAPRGGIDVESLSAVGPGLVLEEPLLPQAGLTAAQIERIAAGLGFTGGTAVRARDVAAGLAAAFGASQAILLEINPLVLVRDGRLVAADAKAEIDDNALPFRTDLRELRDPDDGTPDERAAAEAGLSLIRLDGDIGCVVNGAGLAMATMDLVALAGGRPANFLDVGGGVSEDAVARAFSLVVSDSGVRAVLVNIFGGIVRCDLVVRGLVRSARSGVTRVPVVMRLEGTNVEEGRALVAASGLPFVLVPDMGTAAREAVRLAREGKGPR
ncbi:MAG: ADP-forming succinate--CoA ligase subunit beta [Acidobacteria bacterium]|nr:ADP-forming succinate--CoA ligase subunit beta [Acidobacteriota bacterium]